jgi:hypothetical protein
MQLEELLDWHESPTASGLRKHRSFRNQNRYGPSGPLCEWGAKILHALDYFDDVVEDIGFVNKMLDSGSLDL